MQTEPHPSRFELEALQVGEGTPGIAHHVQGCAACAGYVATLADEAARFALSARPVAFIAAVEDRVKARRARWRLGRIAPVALAAIPLLAIAAAPADRIGLRLAAQLDDVLAKGSAAVEVALVRERAGQQVRLVGPVAARAGDRFAIELRVTRPVELEVVVVEGGTRLPIARGHYAPGVHHLAGFALDDQPSDALLLVGPPARVERALAGEHQRGVVSVAIRSAGAR